MKKLYVVILVLLTLCSCGKKENDDPSIKDAEPKQEVKLISEPSCLMKLLQ